MTMHTSKVEAWTLGKGPKPSYLNCIVNSNCLTFTVWYANLLFNSQEATSTEKFTFMLIPVACLISFTLIAMFE